MSFILFLSTPTYRLNQNVLVHLFQFLDRSALSQTFLVSKQWNLAAGIEFSRRIGHTATLHLLQTQFRLVTALFKIECSLEDSTKISSAQLLLSRCSRLSSFTVFREVNNKDDIWLKIYLLPWLKIALSASRVKQLKLIILGWEGSSRYASLITWPLMDLLGQQHLEKFECGVIIGRKTDFKVNQVAPAMYLVQTLKDPELELWCWPVNPWQFKNENIWSRCPWRLEVLVSFEFLVWPDFTKAVYKDSGLDKIFLNTPYSPVISMRQLKPSVTFTALL